MNPLTPLRRQRYDRSLSLHELCNAIQQHDGERRPDPVAVGLIERGILDRPALLKRMKAYYAATAQKQKKAVNQ